LKEELLFQALSTYVIPSQSLWRAFELQAATSIRDSRGLEEPILEIGCGDGMFASLLFEKVSDGIDINPKCIERQRSCNHAYGELHCMNACDMSFPDDKYMLAIANCVIEHIEEYEKVIAETHRVLRPGGKFVFTVPLSGMNNYLLSSSPCYINMRQRQLNHLNLFTGDEWVTKLKKQGFENIDVIPYLYGRECRLWDLLDAPVCFGYKRYKVASAYLLLYRIMPPALQNILNKALAGALSLLLRNRRSGDPCAALIVAEKG